MRRLLVQRLCSTRTSLGLRLHAPKIAGSRWLSLVADHCLPYGHVNYDANLIKQTCRHYSQKASSSRSTIFALSSGHGKSGVAVIRISGPKAATVTMDMTRRTNLPEARKAILTGVYHHSTGEMLDKGMVLWFPGPSSFTGEDVCELHVHGGPAVVNAIHEALESMLDVQHAEPGEFTKRAFLNGKLDLTEVEGMADLIHAETEAQRKQALRQMEGELGKMYGDWRTRLLRTLAHVEAYIDFSEDENIEEGVLEQAQEEAKVLHQEIQSHLEDNRRGERLRNGVHVAILGKPNVGKSSLLNAICQRPAAIVSPLAGTTRDVVESAVNIGGYPVLLSDTAGMRHSEDVVEREGVRRARLRAKEADIRVIMLSAQHLQTSSLSSMDNPTHQIQTLLQDFKLTSQQPSGVDSEDECQIVDPVDGAKPEAIVVLNKLDLVHDFEESLNEMCRDGVIYGGDGDEEELMPCCVLSCKTGAGLERFLQVLRDKVKYMCGNPLAGNPSLTQARHRRYLIKCVSALNDFETQGDIVMAAEHLRIALRRLGKMTGRVGAEEILDVVFSDFCIGK